VSMTRIKSLLKVSILKFFILFCVVTLPVACGQSESVAQSGSDEYTVTSVSKDKTFYMDTDQLASIVVFNSAQLKMCNLTIIKSKFKQGYTTRITQLGVGDIDLFCVTDIDGFDRFAMTEQSDLTSAKMTVTQLTDTAVVTLNFSLKSFKSENILTRHNVSLDLDKNQLNTLLSR